LSEDALLHTLSKQMLEEGFIAIAQRENNAAILTLKRSYLRVDDEELRLVGGMQANMVGDGLVKALLNAGLVMGNAFQVGIQVAHMRVHDLNQQRLFICIVIINTRGLNACQTRNIAHRCRVIAIFREQLHRRR